MIVARFRMISNSPGARNLRRSVRETGQTNWRAIVAALRDIAIAAIATFILLYCWMSP